MVEKIFLQHCLLSNMIGSHMENISTDIIIIGAGLAGLVAAAEATDAGRRVIILDQEPEASLGGQAFWSLGGLFLVNTPEQRRFGIHDSRELALQDWLASAQFDREEDAWPKKWAEAYVDFAAGEMRDWLYAQGFRFLSFAEWPERGGYLASGHGNSIPRFHLVWGSGPGVLAPFLRRIKQAETKGQVQLHYRHRVTELIVKAGVVNGVKGELLEPSTALRGSPSSRVVIGEFAMQAQAVIITSGGIGANHDLVRQYWPTRLGSPPQTLLSGVPDHVDGMMLNVAQTAGSKLINMDRMWHYPEGLHYFAPIWNRHAIRVLSGPSPLWLDAHGVRLPPPLFPGFDALSALGHINRTGYSHSWFLLNQHIIKREFALSGSDQNPDLTAKNKIRLLRHAWSGPTEPVKQFIKNGSDFVIHHHLADLVRGMNELTGEELITLSHLEYEVKLRDQQILSGYGKDAQIMAIRAARRYLPHRWLRIASLNCLANPKHGPFIAVRLSILTRKTLGGLATDISARVLNHQGDPLPGLYAAGEATGFGGGGMHGYRALEGTFLGGCIFSGRVAGRAAAASVA